MIVEDERLTGVRPGETSAAVTVIEVDETLSAAADVASVIDSASGTVVRRLGGLGDFSAVSIRGSSFRQVQVFLDGVPLNPDGSEVVNLSELPLSAFSRVEIYRGSAPPQLAAAPIGGVVNLISGDREAPTAGALSYGRFQTSRLSVATEQRDDLRGADSRALLLADVFSTQGDFRYFSDNATTYNVIDDDRPLRQNNDKSQLNSYGRWRLTGDRVALTIGDAFLAREEGLPGSANAPTESARLQTTRNIATAQLEGCGDRHSWQGRLWHQVRAELLDDRSGEVGLSTQWQRGLTSTTGTLGSVTWSPQPWLLPAATLSARQDRYLEEDRLTDTIEDPRVRYAATGSLSADAWLASEQVKISPVLQASLLDNRLLGTVPFSETPIAPEGEELVTSINPRAGLLLRPHAVANLALKGNIGRYFRPPDFTELFGDRGGIIGNSELLPERGWQWDAGVRYASDSIPALTGAVDLTWFSSTTTDQIVFVQNSQRTSVPINFGETHTDGIEAALTASILGVVDSQSNVTWTRSENRTDTDELRGNQLPRVPRWEVYQGTSVRWRDHLRLGHTFSYTDGNYWDATNVFRAAPRAIHGAFARISASGLSAEASVLNLTDQTVAVMERNPLSSDDDATILQPITDFTGFPLPGRTWLLTLRWSG
ncbi:MAG: vitamin B12 transporter [Myxococcota bacterium]|jgi:vitamin B12 transporter